MNEINIGRDALAADLPQRGNGGEAIRVSHVVKRFKNVTAVDNLSFVVPEGSLFAFLGSNGAGKTTTISCMTTLLAPTEGSITVDGYDVVSDPYKVRERIGVVFQQSLLDPRLSVQENLSLKAGIYGVPNSRIDHLSDLVDLGDFRDRPYGVLSGGQKRRADIARALLHQPKIIFLDEPTAGLDPQSREQIWRAITDLRQQLGLTVVLTTHYMQETEFADHVLVIDKGRVIAAGTPIELRARYSTPTLLIKYSESTRQLIIATIERHIPGARWHDEGGAIITPLERAYDALPIINELSEDAADFQVMQGSMDDVFLNLMKETHK